MIPEIAHFALILCLPIAACLAMVSFLGVWATNNLWMRSSRLFATLLFALLLFSFALLCIVFLQDDFSVNLVANHSNVFLPMHYKFSAVWGNHEGSLLLWALILSAWTLAVALFSRNLPLDIVARVLAVLGLVSLGFLLFILLTSNPFERTLLNTPADGRDLNPLLQDIGLILHPPLLYVGYVGFSVVFAFAIAALMTGRLDAAWARWCRPWTNIAWAFLTIGIALGSWWAYYELGWGGWWFWDPVENASFMPWLAGTALVHSLSATEKRGVFKSWTVLLAIFTFSLSLLGTFLVRSGILVSVHAFASDPDRGLFILAFLAVVIGGSLLLYAIKAPQVNSRVKYSLFSRESALLVNNILLSVALATVLLGTLFPLIMKALDRGTYSVGPPYFNALFVPISVVLLLVMGLSPSMQWKRTRIAGKLIKSWVMIGILSLSSAAIFPLMYDGEWHLAAAITAFISIWVVLTTVYYVYSKAKSSNGFSFGRLPLSVWSMVLAHIGIAVSAWGIGMTSVYSEQRDVRLSIGDRLQLGAYQFNLVSVKDVQGPNYQSKQGLVEVFVGNKLVAKLEPEKRFYSVQRNTMTEAGISAGLSRDLYVALGEQLGQTSWALRVHIKPFVRCIWLGALMIAAGAVLSVFDSRYRSKSSVKSSTK